MQNINEIIALNAELEGLLHVLAKRDNASIRELLKTKYANYTSAFEKLLAEMESTPTEESPAQLEQVDHVLAQDEAKDQEAVSGEVEDEMDAATEAIEHGEQEDEASLLQDDPEVVEFDHEDSQPVVFEEEPAESESRAEIRVDEMLSRKGATDLKRVFTLNDKFLFRKALFNQDDSLFAETLEHLAALDSFDQAKAYLANDLGWNLADENVDLFLSIIKPHYEQ